MIIVIGVALAVGVMLLLKDNYFYKYYDAQWKETTIIVSSVLIPIIIVLGTIWLNVSMCSKGESIERIDLYAGYNDNEISGRFFLLGGHIDERDVVYYWVDNNGVKSKHSQPMYKSVFIEDGGEYLLLKKDACPEAWWWLFICGDTIAEFHVPENSIRQLYQYQ